MKKAFLVLACVCFVVAATSCKKSCVCKDSKGDVFTSGITTDGIDKEACDALNTVGKLSGAYTCAME